MAGRPGRSGGHNKLSYEEHRLRGTINPTRHRPPLDVHPVRDEDRAAALAGLSGEALRVASQLLARFDGWDPAGLETLRNYSLSCQRLRALQAEAATDPADIQRESRCNLALLSALELDR